MSGQSATMSVEEVRKCLAQIEHPSTHSRTHGGKSGSGKKGGGTSSTNVHTKVKHQG